MKKLPIALIMLVLAACQLHESIEPINNGSTVLNRLANGANNSRLWKIENAVLTNATNPDGLTISELANVRDDEFEFNAFEDSLVKLSWRVRNEIKADATDTKGALLDYYLSPIVRELTIDDDGKITSGDPNLKIGAVSESKVSIQYRKGSTQLTLDLTPQIDQPLEIPSTLQFKKISEVSGKGIEQAAGFTGSMATNSLYISYKSLEGDFPERVLKYDIGNNLYKSQDFSHLDFVTKELYIINDELKVVGGRYVNTYSLELDKDPVTVPHNLVLTRFGSTTLDDNIFLFGGDLQSPSSANAIYMHDQVSGHLNLVGTLPESRYWAHGEIVDGKLYVFGGRQEFNTEVAEADIYVWDISSGNSATFKLPNSMHRTFTSRYEHLIVVGGQHIVSGQVPEIETTLGIFNTHDNTFKTIQTSIGFSGQRTIYGLTVVGTKLYILVGTAQDYIFSIYEADI